MSRDAHRQLREERQERVDADAEASAPRLGTSLAGTAAAAPASTETSRARSMAVGTALHALLEAWDFDGDETYEVDRQRGRLPRLLADLGFQDEAALQDAEAALDRFVASPLFGRFAALGPQVVARELPLLTPALPGEAGETGPIDAWVGAIDLLYRNEQGELVVADYKSDEVEGEEALRERAQSYQKQGEYYVRAVQEGLGLAQAPRFELWFLRSGEVLALDL